MTTEAAERKASERHIHFTFGEAWKGDVFGGEGMWAESVYFPFNTGIVRVANTPFFLDGVALGDIIEVDNDGEAIRFVEDGGKVVVRATIMPGAKGKVEWVDSILRGDHGLGKEDTAGEAGYDVLYVMSLPRERLDKAVTILRDLNHAGMITGYQIAKE